MLNKSYNSTRLDLQFNKNNSILSFSISDNETSDFYIRLTKEDVKVDLTDSIIVMCAIDPNNQPLTQFVDVTDNTGIIHCDLKPHMKSTLGKYNVKLMLVKQNERIVTSEFSYVVNNDCFVELNATVESDSRYAVLDEMLTRLSNVVIEEDKRVAIEKLRVQAESLRVEAEQSRRTEFDTMKSNEEVRKSSELERVSSETTRCTNEEFRIQSSSEVVVAEKERKSNENVRKKQETTRIDNEDNRINGEVLRNSRELIREERESNRISAENVRIENEDNRISKHELIIKDEDNRKFQELIRVDNENVRILSESDRSRNEFNRNNDELARNRSESNRRSEENIRKINENNRIISESARKNNETERQKYFEEMKNNNYATTDYVDESIRNAAIGDINLGLYQTKEDMRLETNSKNVVGAINEINSKSSGGNVDLSEYATKAELKLKSDLNHNHDTVYANKSSEHTHSNKSALDGISSAKVTEWNNKSNFSGNYNDLTNKPVIPEAYNLPIASATTLGGVKVGSGLSMTRGVLSVAAGGVADSVEWTNVQNKPSTFPPATHNHDTNYAAKVSEHTHSNKSPLDKLTDVKLSQYDGAYTHAQSTHSPVTAQKNSDITKVEIEAKLIGDITTHIHNKYVDKVEGKGLSTNDFTNDEKTKLGTLSNYNDAKVKADISTLNLQFDDVNNNKYDDILITGNELSMKANGVVKKTVTLPSGGEVVEGHTHTNKAVIDKITEAKLTSWDNKLDSIPAEYVTDSELTAKGYLTQHQDISGKVDKVTGKGLSSNDYTTIEKTKLSKVEENANNYTHPSKHLASEITEDIAHRFVTDIEKSNWNSKSDFSGSYVDLTDKPVIPVVDVTKNYVDTELAKKSPTHEHPYKSDSYIPAWNEITSKPSTFTPSTHEHDKYIKYDATSVLGDANSFRTTGYRKTNRDTINLPPGRCTSGVVANVFEWEDRTGSQTFYVCSNTNVDPSPAIGEVWMRSCNNTLWSAWKRIVTKDLLDLKSDIHEHPYKSNTYVPSWGEITSKPSVFNPSSHTHSASEITDLPTGGSIDFGANNTWTGTNVFQNIVTNERNGEVQKMMPLTANSACYYAFYKNRVNRSGYFGYESSSNNDFVIANESSNANVNVKTSGTGQLQYNGSEVAKKTEIESKLNKSIYDSAIGNYKIWSGTQAEYDAITTKDANTLYFIKEV